MHGPRRSIGPAIAIRRSGRTESRSVVSDHSHAAPAPVSVVATHTRGFGAHIRISPAHTHNIET